MPYSVRPRNDGFRRGSLGTGRGNSTDGSGGRAPRAGLRARTQARSCRDRRTVGFLRRVRAGQQLSAVPEGFAKKLPAGATLIFQLHYTPNGTATSDQTQLGLVFSDTPSEHLVRNVGIANTEIEIPPGASSHAEQATLKVPTDVRLLAFMPHMHLRGKAFRFDLFRPDGQRQRLLDVPRYDFNWQLEYRLADPLDVPQNSRIEVTGGTITVAGNPANPDPTETVRWGPQTEDEMLLGYIEYYLP